MSASVYACGLDSFGGLNRITVSREELTMPQPIIQVDAFTSAPFSGNPAAVCVLSEPRDEVWMQHVAREMNLAETAFLRARSDGFDLRWFTPTVEVDLCGHATLASAHVLWETGQLALTETARFHTRSGLLTAVRRGDWIELDFPATPDKPTDPPPGLIEALGLTPLYVGRSAFDYLVQVDTQEAVLGVQPDFGRLRRISTRGVIVTSQARSDDCDFVSRFFAPGAGIDEDPVTGSAHCCLAPFWNRLLWKENFVARQLSARGGILKVRLEGDRVRLAGEAVTVLRGELLA
jgi:PhzF family phenazine biosynthesis protein